LLGIQVLNLNSNQEGSLIEAKFLLALAEISVAIMYSFAVYKNYGKYESSVFSG
jgi:hypothetical protein